MGSSKVKFAYSYWKIKSILSVVNKHTINPIVLSIEFAFGGTFMLIFGVFPS